MLIIILYIILYYILDLYSDSLENVVFTIFTAFVVSSFLRVFKLAIKNIKSIKNSKILYIKMILSEIV